MPTLSPRTTSSPWRLLARLFATFALVLSAVLAPASVALAHDELIGTTPADGEQVAAPEELALEFTGEIAAVGAQVRVDGPEGEVMTEALVVEGTTVTQPLPAELPSGEYTATWRVTSEDGHPISGTFTFTATPGSAAADEDAGEDADSDASTADPTPSEQAGAETDEQTAAPTESPGDDDPTSADGNAAPPTDSADDVDQGVPWWTWVLVVLALGALGWVGSKAARQR